MSEQRINDIAKQLEPLLGLEISARSVRDINAALQVAELLKSRGFSFEMKDCCPRSMNDTLWRAIFAKDEMKYMAEDVDSAVAICVAAIDALGCE
ncbi:MAG: hypothetical protein KKE73_07870 [Proteobacteria bacterium]|nr:hypothetical protein [Pseudomonadota bacterium]